jgi:hypothetical protein
MLLNACIIHSQLSVHGPSDHGCVTKMGFLSLYFWAGCRISPDEMFPPSPQLSVV